MNRPDSRILARHFKSKLTSVSPPTKTRPAVELGAAAATGATGVAATGAAGRDVGLVIEIVAGGGIITDAIVDWLLTLGSTVDVGATGAAIGAATEPSVALAVVVVVAGAPVIAAAAVTEGRLVARAQKECDTRRVRRMASAGLFIEINT